MKTLKKVIRALVLFVLIILAATGILAIFLPPTRERPMDKEITKEQWDENKEDEDDQEEKN
jgi:hypothetical protein